MKKFLEAVARCSAKMVFLEISQNSQENSCARVSFLIKLQAKCFPVNFVKFLRAPFLKEHLRWLFLNFLTLSQEYPDQKNLVKNRTPVPRIHNHPKLVSSPLPLDVINWHSILPPGKRCFWNILKNFNNEIILSHCSLKWLQRYSNPKPLSSWTNTQPFTILKSLIKLTGNRTDFSQANFYQKQMYFQCLY